MDEQLKSLMTSSNNPVPNLMSPILNLFQLSGTGPTIGQLGGTNTPSSTGNTTDPTRPRQDTPVPKGPGIINPALIKRRIRDPNLIPEYGAPYVPTPQDNNAGGVNRGPDGDPSTHDSATVQQADADNPIKAPGTGTDYIAARNTPAGNTGPVTDTTGDMAGASRHGSQYELGPWKHPRRTPHGYRRLIGSHHSTHPCGRTQ
jgi:hypothetical protein